MKKTKIDASAFLLALIVLLLVGGVVFAATYVRSDPVTDSLDEDKVINTLFVIEDKDKPLCSYVLMYYPATKRAAVFDIPGSLGLIIQRINRVDRIDMVYDPRRIAPFADELENLLGIDIPISIVITLENLGKITDLIEGVELFIPSPVDEFHNERIMFPSGINYLDGDKARAYITYELPEESSEMAVYRRQRFFVGFIKRLGSQNSFLKNPQVAGVFHSLLKTGIKARTQNALLEKIAGIDTDRISIQSVSGNVREVSGQQLIFPHWDGNLIKEIVRQTLAGLVQPSNETMGDRIFTVEILNGTTVNGLAGRTAELFGGFGYDVISIGNADRNDYENTVIIDRTGLQDLVLAFGEVIRCSNVRTNSPVPDDEEIDLNVQNMNYQADLTLIIGKDFNGRYVTN
jgi:anionic cell wall polymer biosynthesis LytR-Cps2A-Psr (LCP) family protein